MIQVFELLQNILLKKMSQDFVSKLNNFFFVLWNDIWHILGQAQIQRQEMSKCMLNWHFVDEVLVSDRETSCGVDYIMYVV